MKGRTYRYMTQDALYPFGYGLSYTSFSYSQVQTDTCQVGENGITVRAVVKNTGSMTGGETVQAYVKICREGTPNAQLKGIRKLHLAPGEEAEISLHLAREAFGLYDEDGCLQYYPGDAIVYLGGQAPDCRSRELTGQSVTALHVKL